MRFYLMTSYFSPHSRLNLAGYSIAVMTPQQLVEVIASAILYRHATNILFANAHFVVKCQSLQRQLSQCNAIIVNDGIAVDIVAWILFRRRFPHNMNGTDFLPFLFDHLRKPGRFFLLGSRGDVVFSVASRLTAIGHTVVGLSDGYQAMHRSGPTLIHYMNACQPDIILVALGNPFQEQWIVNHRQVLNAPVLIGVGAFFDFYSQSLRRAPNWLRRCRLEWLYRLLGEPRRLCKRYTWDVLRFLRLSLWHQKARK